MEARKLLGMLVVLSSISACSTVDKVTKKINPGTEATNPSQELASVSATNAEIQVKVTGIAKATDGWLEYRMTISNRGRAVIGDLNGYVIDKEGREFEAAKDEFMLNEPPKFAEGMLLTTGAAAGSMGLAMMGMPFIGPLLMGGMLLYQTNQVDDSLAGSMNFIRSSFAGGAVYVNDEKKGAFFFPAVNAEKLKITYLVGNTRRSIVIGQEGNVPKPSVVESVATQERVANAPAMSLIEVQRRLKAIGYDPGPIDGKNGKKTTAAISQFQKDSRLSVTGQLHPATIEALKGKSGN